MTEDELYRTALTKSNPDERTSYLDRACGDDPALRQRVESLLTQRMETEPHTTSLSLGERFPEVEADSDPTSALSAESEATPASPPGSRPVVRQIGPYKLLQTLGEGGMGVVYLAEQERPVRRRVALKVIKPGAISTALIARFEAERQALALMDHANIAKVFDAGATDAGGPFLVMELVQGVPITRYCDDCRMPVLQRLQLFILVCRAIQHAHQKGIIHRDIKPSNVLVTSPEGMPVPKVIDFGVAKAIDQKLADDTVCTRVGTVVGTLEYMSPEQAEMSPEGVDTRSDVYSLGVLLYELLTGTTPLARDLLRQANFAEMLRIIREEEPPSPSLRLAGSDQLSELAGRRQMVSAKLVRQVRGELDWIAMKALEKDRSRRYETADALARDVERFLQAEAVEASPPSASYRLKKFARKHRGLLTAAAAFAALLLAAASFSTWLAVRATRAEASAHEQMIRADTQAANAGAISEFLRNDLLAQASAEIQAGKGFRPDRDVTIRTLLDRAAARISGKFEGKPLVEAAVRETIGSTYVRLGMYPQAEKHLERAVALYASVLGSDDPHTLTSMNDLALLYESQGRYEKAEPLLERVLAIRLRVLGPDSSDTLMSMNNLGLLYHSRGRYHDAEPLLTQTLQTRRSRLGDEHPDTLASMNNLALLYEALGEVDRVEPLLSEALSTRRRVLGDDHPNTLTSIHNLGLFYRSQRRLDRAEPLLVRALDGRRRVLGNEHPDTISSMSSLALLYSTRGDFIKAEPLFKQALEIRERELGEDHPNTSASLTNLGLVYESKGELAKAVPLLTRALEGRKKTLGAQHPETLMAMNNLGVLFLALRQPEKAEPLLNNALENQRQLLGPEHPATLQSETNLAKAYESRGEFALEEPLLQHALVVVRQSRGNESPEVAAALATLGMNQLRQKKYVEAEEPLRESVRLYAGHQSEGRQGYATRSLLGESLLGQKKYTEAEPALLAAYEGLKQKSDKLPGEAKQSLLTAIESLVRLYEALGQKDKAEQWRRQLKGSERNDSVH